MSYGRSPYYIYRDGEAVNWYGAWAARPADPDPEEAEPIRIAYAAMRQFLHSWPNHHPEARTLADLHAAVDEEFREEREQRG